MQHAVFFHVCSTYLLVYMRHVVSFLCICTRHTVFFLNSRHVISFLCIYIWHTVYFVEQHVLFFCSTQFSFRSRTTISRSLPFALLFLVFTDFDWSGLKYKAFSHFCNPHANINFVHFQLFERNRVYFIRPQLKICETHGLSRLANSISRNFLSPKKSEVNPISAARFVVRILAETRCIYSRGVSRLGRIQFQRFSASYRMSESLMHSTVQYHMYILTPYTLHL